MPSENQFFFFCVYVKSSIIFSWSSDFEQIMRYVWEYPFSDVTVYVTFCWSGPIGTSETQTLLLYRYDVTFCWSGPIGTSETQTLY